MLNLFENNVKGKMVLVGLLAVVFITLSVFGAIIISYHLDGNCLSSFLNSENCPGKSFAAIEHHLALPHLFSSVVVTSISLISLLLIAGLFALVQPLTLRFSSFPMSRRFRPAEKIFSRISPRIREWLSLFQNSPNF